MYRKRELEEHLKNTNSDQQHGVPMPDIAGLVRPTNAAVNGKLELTLLKGRQRFDTVSTSNLKV